MNRSQLVLSLTVAFLLGAYVSQHFTGQVHNSDGALANAELIKELIRQQALIGNGGGWPVRSVAGARW